MKGGLSPLFVVLFVASSVIFGCQKSNDIPKTQPKYVDQNTFRNACQERRKDEWRPVSDMAFRNNCVPADVSTWTLHGLWPTVGGRPKPVSCNKSWPFFEQKIEDLEPKMMQRWLAFPDTSKSNSLKLWSHEWEKHGTCSTDLNDMNSEHKYFEMALCLNTKYDLLRNLSDEKIFPSDDMTYSIKEVNNAITTEYGAKGRVICLRGPDDQQYLGGIRICLDKSFEPIDCIQTDPEGCNEEDGLAYPIIERSAT